MLFRSNYINGNYLITEQFCYDVNSKSQSLQNHLTNIYAIPKQLEAYQHVIDAVLSSHGGAFFLSSPGGMGKIYIYNTICHHLRLASKIILCVSLNGIATLLLPSGHTAHCTFQIPINNLDTKSICNISKQDKRADLLHMLNFIIWDEAPTQS